MQLRCADREEGESRKNTDLSSRVRRSLLKEKGKEEVKNCWCRPKSIRKDQHPSKTEVWRELRGGWGSELRGRGKRGRKKLRNFFPRNEIKSTRAKKLGPRQKGHRKAAHLKAEGVVYHKREKNQETRKVRRASVGWSLRKEEIECRSDIYQGWEGSSP